MDILEIIKERLQVLLPGYSVLSWGETFTSARGTLNSIYIVRCRTSYSDKFSPAVIAEPSDKLLIKPFALCKCTITIDDGVFNARFWDSKSHERDVVWEAELADPDTDLEDLVLRVAEEIGG